MSSFLRPITWVSPLGRPRLGASAFSEQDTARSWILLCYLATGIAADDMLGPRAEAAREWRAGAPFDLTDEPVRRNRFRRIPRSHGHPLRPPHQPGTAVVRIGMRRSWESCSNARA